VVTFIRQAVRERERKLSSEALPLSS